MFFRDTHKTLGPSERQGGWLSLPAAVVMVAISLFVSTVGTAQSKQDVATWLERDVAIVINIQDVETVFDRVSKLPLFRNPRFFKAVSMISDERFPVLDADSVAKLAYDWEVLRSDLRQIDELTIVVDTKEDLSVNWSVFARSNPVALERMEQTMSEMRAEIKSGATKARLKSPPLSRFEKAEAKTFLDDTRNFGNTIRVKNWLVVSNDSRFLKELPERVDNDQFRSLGKSRKYRAIRKHKTRLDGRDSLISVYGNPVKLWRFMPNMSRNEWELLEIDELPSFGMNLVISDLDKSENEQPLILADTVIKFTQPTVGKAKLLEHYRPVEIPALAYSPTELTAFARDENLITTESVRLYDQTHGANAADAVWRIRFRPLGIDYHSDARNRRQAFCEYRFLGSDNSVDNPGLVSLELMDDKAASLRYGHKLLGYAESHYDRKFDVIHDGETESWIAQSKAPNGRPGRRGYDRKRHQKNDFFSCFHDAYIWTDRWWVQGDLPAVKRQVELLTSNEGRDYGVEIRALVDDLARRLGDKNPPLIVRYFQPEAWQDFLNEIENQYAIAHRVKQRFIFRAVYDEKTGQTGYRMEKTTESDDAEIDNESNTESKFGDGLAPLAGKKFEMMVPMELGTRSSDGVRIPINRRSDLAAAIEVMIWKSVFESFRQQLLVVSKDDHYIRVKFAAWAK